MSEKPQAMPETNGKTSKSGPHAQAKHRAPAAPRSSIPPTATTKSAPAKQTKKASSRTQPSLKEALKRIGLKQIELAQLIDVSPRTVSLWATGDAPLPGPVSGYLRLLAKLSSKDRRAELSRIKGRRKMFDEGLYALRYIHSNDNQRETGGALAVLRSGKILGSDRWGGVFTGSYDFDAATETNTMHVRLSVPPNGELITGHEAGSEGTTIDIVGTFERAAPLSSSTVDVAGQPVDVELTYLGPLPT